MDLARKDAEFKAIEVDTQSWRENLSPTPADSKRTAR